MWQTKEQQAALHYVKSLLSPYLESFLKQMPVPVQKFITQMLYGIIASRSVIVQQVSVSLGEAIRLKKTCERLYRNLGKCSVLSDLLMDRMIKQLAPEIKESTGIIIDLSDINKTGATKMEGLAKVWDGSQSKANQGYFTLQASICHHSKPQEIQLLYSELFSLEIEDTSENTKILDLIHNVIINTDNRGIFIMDRGMDSTRILTDLLENNTSFIIRGDNRHLVYKDQNLSYLEIAMQSDLPYQITSKKRNFKAGIVPVQFILPNDENNWHQRKKKANLYLVVAKEKGHGYVYYLCSFNKSYTDLEMVNLAIKYYGLRWSIEEVHRQIKQDFHWEDIQLLHYYSLKNMNALLWLAASFIYNKVRNLTKYLITRFPERLLYRQLSLDLNKNLTYRISALVSYLFGLFKLRKNYSKHNRKRHQTYTSKDQLCLSLELT